MGEAQIKISDIIKQSFAEFAVPKPLRAEPAPRPRRYTIISADDHALEPAHLFKGRLPAKFADRAPKVVEDDKGFELWKVEDELVPLQSGDAVVSWDLDNLYIGPMRYDMIRKGMWDIKERIRDMDTAGVAASLCFPSMVWGFCGARFASMKDQELALACVRAYNDWMIDEWVGYDPTRMIPMALPWMRDAKISADEVRRNAARGFKAVSFCENPEKLGLPSLYSDYWDPFFAACQETDTAINIHIGSSNSTIQPSKDSPPEVTSKILTMNSIMAVMDWIYAKVPVKFPKIKIVMAEGGVGWQLWLIDRLNQQHDKMAAGSGVWGTYELTPSQVLLRNFYFTSFFDPNGWKTFNMMDPTKLMVEMDYPHFDSTWPDTQEAVRLQLEGLPNDFIKMATHENASALYRHKVPAEFRV